MCTRHLESQVAFKISELNTAVAEPEVTEPRLRLAKDLATRLRNQAQSQRPPLHKVEGARVVTETALAAAESNVQFLTASELPLWCQISRVT